ncbi:class I SAM-dependent methyltransferase [Synechococcus sp. MIT S9504]|uniref:class I SAM-dependent methyltransferase n=2 Tax=Synechococcus sp. MIT S9504 TaxID=1801628 RepID=UPI0007BBCB0A|nr:Trans-aconitate 2-methyltransferase [Synechococcus sp. MIT S9504]
MILRIPEPEVMNDPLQVDAYAAADFSGTDQAMVERICTLLQSSGASFGAKSRLLDLGCGPGNITARLARRWPHCSVLGLDAADRMIAVAEDRLRDFGLSHERLRYKKASLPIHQADQPADLIVSNSLLHHLHDPQQLWSSLIPLASPHCLVLHRDLRRPDSEASIDQLCECHVADAPAVLQRDYRASLHASFTLDEVKEQLLHAGLGHLRVVAVEDRYLEVSGWIMGCQAGSDQRRP